MEFGILNLTGVVIVAVMMIPNIVFALRGRRTEDRPICRAVLIVEQIGRYGAMALMVLPLGVWKFGFKSPEALIAWVAICVALLAAYLVCWIFYFRRPSLGRALWLAVLPSLIFILRGVF